MRQIAILSPIACGSLCAALLCGLLLFPPAGRADDVNNLFDWIRRGFSDPDNPEAESEELSEAEQAQSIVTEGPLKVFFDESTLGTTNAYGPGGVTYFATRMVLTNMSDEGVEIASAEIELQADNEVLPLARDLSEIGSIPIRTGDTRQALSDLRTPETIRVSAGQTRAVWLVFTNVPGSIQTPHLILRMSVGGERISADISEFHSRILELSQERIGPEGCVCVMRINGQLDSINANDLVNALVEALNQNVSRFVIAWPEEGKEVSDEVAQWLLSSRMPRHFGFYSTNALLPTLPGDMKELNIVRLPSRNGVDRYSRVINGMQQTSASYENEEAAVVDALRSVAINLSSDSLMEEIRDGHPSSRTAMLVHGAHLLPPSALPLVLELTESESEDLRLAAIAALGEFSEQEAVEALTELAREGSNEERRSAVAGLARSRFPAAHEQLQQLLAENRWTIDRNSMIQILARYPREEWNSLIADAAGDSDAEVRLTAIQALARLGHPDRLALLTEALSSDDQEIRAEAFRQLISYPDPAAQEVVIVETIRVLEEEGMTGEVHTVLSQYSDPRLVEALLKRFREESINREETAMLLVRMANDSVIDEVLEEFDDLNDDVKANVLQMLMQIEHPRMGELARDCLESSNTNLVRTAANALRIEGSDESIALIIETLRNTEDTNTWYSICASVVYSGGSELEGVLIEARNSDDEERRRRANDLLQNLRRRSPAGDVLQQAEVFQMSGEWEKVIEICTIAIEIDDRAAYAYSSRGGAHLQLDKPEEAEQDFRRALEIDPYDGSAITGMGAVLASKGEIEAALDLVDEHYDLYRDQFAYVYNIACVCGRGMKFIDGQPEEERDADLRQQLAERAIDELTRSMEVGIGFADFDLLNDDPDLDALRDDPRFQELLDPLRDSADGEVPPQIIFDF